ncbi:MAG: hypothetical protein QNJ97_08580 [Myxococcota bacterium]|nr:hypothetical protein [Myxococcota bacterium]
MTPELKQHWAQVRENWTDQSAHAAFVEAALASGACGFAARCYSSYGTDKIARANLDRIAARLMIMLENSAARTSGHRSRRLIIGILVLVLVLVGLTVFFLHFAP